MSEGQHHDDEVLGGLDGVGVAPEVPAVDGIGAIAEWPECYPQYVYELVAQVTDAEKGANKKKFWSTYEKEWVKLDSAQQGKARGYFGKLADATKERILTAAKTKSVAPPAAAPAVPAAGGGREPNTTKHDMVRLLHVMFDVSLAAVWYKYLT
jgi:hypothetical protein